VSDTEAGRDRTLWYVRRSDEVRGPFPAAQVARHIVLGRVRLGDEVSRDGVQWMPLGDRPELLPAALREASDEDTLWRLRLREDERSGLDRRAGQVVPPEIAERRSGRERRQPEPVALVRRRRNRTEYLQDLRRHTPPRPGRWLWAGLGLVLIAMVAAAMLATNPRPPAGLRCNADPAPGVDWHECRLEALEVSGLDLSGARLRGTKAREAQMAGTRLAGADLAYADLAGAQLSAADLSRASLVGANLTLADLTGANLSGADLSYADLTRARLEGVRLEGATLNRAVWVDGRICAPGSIGACARE
jgi:hypothetical protein